MSNYRWDSASEWLLEKVREKSDDPSYLMGVIDCLIDKVDSDDIQDIFQSEMDEDGYFNEENDNEEEEDEEESDASL